MGTCAKHPERETDYICMKDQVYMCTECLQCRHPTDYCKFRSSCAVWYIDKIEGGKEAGGK